MEADQILVLDHGRIVQHGTHAELLSEPAFIDRSTTSRPASKPSWSATWPKLEPASAADLELVEDSELNERIRFRRRRI